MSRPEGLSGREYRALNFMDRHLQEYDNMPTCSEIKAELELSSSSTAFNIIRSLVKKGFLGKLDGGKYRFKRE